MLSFLLFTTLAIADTKLNTFIEEAEQTAELSARELHLALDPLDQIKGPPALEADGKTIDALRGRARAVIGQVTTELRTQKSCRLPNSGKTAMAAAELGVLRDEAARRELLLKREEKHLGQAFRRFTEAEQSFARIKYQRALAGLKTFNQNLADLAEWLESPRNDGLTSELIAQRPECAGKVARLELLRRAPAGEEDTASGAKNLGKLRFDMDVQQLYGSTDVQ